MMPINTDQIRTPAMQNESKITAQLQDDMTTLRRYCIFLEDLYAAAYSFLDDLFLMNGQEPDSLRQVVAHATQLLDMPHGFLALLTDGERPQSRLAFKVGTGMFSRGIDKYEILTKPILISRKAMVITDYAGFHLVQTDQPYHGLLRTCVVVPLIAHMKLLGILGLAHDVNSQQAITEDEFVILSQYASLVSLVLTKVQAFRDLVQAFETG
jgi:hypothetical protein